MRKVCVNCGDTIDEDVGDDYELGLFEHYTHSEDMCEVIIVDASATRCCNRFGV